MTEFDEWIDAQIEARAGADGMMDRQAVTETVKAAIVDISRAEDLLKTQREYKAAVRMTEQVGAAYDAIIERLKGCCGAEAGERFCEAFGCGTLKEISIQLKAALPAEEGGG